jgi:glycosidase
MEPEKTDPRGRQRPEDDTSFDKELHAFYQEAVALHAANPAFKSSDFAVLAADDEKNVFVYSRGSGTDLRVVAINRSGDPQKIRFTAPVGEVIFDTDDGKDVSVVKNGIDVEIALPPLSGAVLK